MGSSPWESFNHIAVRLESGRSYLLCAETTRISQLDGDRISYAPAESQKHMIPQRDCWGSRAFSTLDTELWPTSAAVVSYSMVVVILEAYV